MATTTGTLITADQLLAMGDVGRCELIYGELVMMSPAGAEHGLIALRIGSFLREHVEANDLGAVFAAETGFLLDRDPDLVRGPDVAFVRKSRLVGGLPRGYFEGGPDLAVEVNSPGDSRPAVAEKVNLWLANGAAAVWVADPPTRTLSVHRVGLRAVRLSVSDQLANEPLLPGFTMPITRVFRWP